MREYDKMISGELYDPTDIELRVLRKRVRELTREYNATTEDDAEKRIEILDRILGSHGKNFYMEPYIRFDYGVNTCVGENFFAKFYLTVLDVAPVIIGNDVMFGPNVTIATPAHPLLIEDRKMRTRENGELYDYEYAKKITIGNGVWIASNVVVNGGVSIGDNSVIGSGSVVTRDIPPNVIAAGVPCRVIRELNESDKMKMPR